MVGNSPASAGDTGSSPGPGGSHVPRSNEARAPQLLSLCSRAREPQLLSPGAAAAGACALWRERPLQWEACARQRGVAPWLTATRESPRAATKTQHSHK